MGTEEPEGRIKSGGVLGEKEKEKRLTASVGKSVPREVSIVV